MDQPGYFHNARQYCMVAHHCPKTSQLTDYHNKDDYCDFCVWVDRQRDVNSKHW